MNGNDYDGRTGGVLELPIMTAEPECPVRRRPPDKSPRRPPR